MHTTHNYYKTSQETGITCDALNAQDYVFDIDMVHLGIYSKSPYY